MGFKLPESVLVVVHTPTLDVLLLERAGKAGLWQSVTGSREPDDQDLEATARREVAEETGLVVGTLTDWRLKSRYEIWPQWRARYAPDVTHNTEHVFGFRVDERTVARLDPAEHVAQLWLPWQQAMEKVFSPTNRDVIWQFAETRRIMKQEASKLGQFSWALFDWANQPFFTVVTTFIFAPYFANVMIGDPVLGQSAWAFTQSTSGLIIAALSPVLGAMADAGGRRKPYVFAFQLLLAAGCAALWWAYPNRPDLARPIGWAVIAATVGAEMSIVFNNAQLPDIVRRERMGWLSGFGWGLGYVGGLIALFMVLAAQFSLGPDPGHALERLTGPASSLWLIVFVLPMFLFTSDRPTVRHVPLAMAARQGVAALVSTLRQLRHYRNALVFLIAFMLYNDGLAAIIGFGGVYASATFGWTTTTLGIFGIILTVFAIPGAFLGGKLDDRFGSKHTVRLATFGVIVATLGIVSVTADRVLFVLPAQPLVATRGLFGSAQEQAFMAFALLLGFCMGPMQAASRTLIGRMAPPEMAGEFYGLFALSGRATAWMAPLAIGIVTAATQSTRLGVACVLVFLVLGFCLLWFVREPERSP